MTTSGHGTYRMKRGLCLLLVQLTLALMPCRADPGDSAETPVSDRPKIGLVLGGGGALGFAHIGVIEALEEMRVPIDCIAGTSMGALIGALYASGMSPDEIRRFLLGIDWWDVMKDRTPRRELFFRRKQDDQRYLFNLEFGLQGMRLKMPSGVAAGQKFNNLMQSATLRAVGVTDFDKLPIPYRAVATDLKTAEKVVLSIGNLATVMRASMAVPGAFTPVELDGRQLVDGGLVDNIPVGVAREMGADIVIAVDVGASEEKDSREKLGSLSGILGRTYQLMRRPHQVEALKDANVVITPDLTGFGPGQFHRVAEIIPTGRSAAESVAEALAPYRVDEAGYRAFLERQRVKHPTAIPVSDVTVTGNQRVDGRVIRGRIRCRGGEVLDMGQVNRDLMWVYGIGDFEHVLFRVNPLADGTYELQYRVKEKPWGPTYMRFGLRLQSDLEEDADWSVLLNITSMNLNILGAEWRTDLEFGSSSRVFCEFYQPLDFTSVFFVAPNVEYKSELQDLYDEGHRVAEYDVSTVKGRLDFGVQLRRYAELRVGPFWGYGEAEVDTGASGLPGVDEEIAGGVLTLTVDQQDRTIFAHDGYYFTMEAITAREFGGSDREFDRLLAQYRQFMSWGDHTMLVGLQGGTSFGGDLPGYAEFLLGGPHRFAGLAEDQLRGQYMASGSLGYRYRISRLPPSLGRGVYAMLRGDLGNVWQESSDVDFNDTLWGLGGGLGADTALGPAYVGYGYADGGSDRFYFSLGTAF